MGYFILRRFYYEKQFMVPHTSVFQLHGQTAKGVEQPVLKNFGYDGVYRDQCISVSVLLENPANYGLDADYLTFAVSVRKTVNHTLSVRMEDFSFYLMDEQNQIYNMQKTPDSQPDNTMFSHDNNEPVYRINSLIFAEFKSEFLFQNLRIAFYYKKDQCLHIIELTH